MILHGDSYDEAAVHAASLAKEHGYTYVHPFDDEDVIAGQGTIGMEILRQHTSSLDLIYVPVGGGGLISGIPGDADLAEAIKLETLNPGN